VAKNDRRAPGQRERGPHGIAQPRLIGHQNKSRRTGAPVEAACRPC
jgi:hypothetical protein